MALERGLMFSRVGVCSVTATRIISWFRGAYRAYKIAILILLGRLIYHELAKFLRRELSHRYLEISVESKDVNVENGVNCLQSKSLGIGTRGGGFVAICLVPPPAPFFANVGLKLQRTHTCKTLDSPRPNNGVD